MHVPNTANQYLRSVFGVTFATHVFPAYRRYLAKNGAGATEMGMS